MKMKKLVTIVLATAFILAFCTTVWANSRSRQSLRSQEQQRRRLSQNRNVDANLLPLGWRYQTGYTLWRLSRDLPATPSTYRMYRNDRGWHHRMHEHHRVEGFLFNTIDWTVEEIASFLHRNQDLLRFHPAGIE